MCEFLSIISSGDGKVYYFNAEQRRNWPIHDQAGNNFETDSHASIATFYRLDEDLCNKWAYNPFTETLKLDMQHTADDRDAVMATINAISDDDWRSMCGNVWAIRALIAEAKAMEWLDNHGDDSEFPGCVKIFDTRAAAGAAAGAAAWAAAGEAAWEAAWAAAEDAAWNATWDAARTAAGAAAWAAAWDATRAAAWAAARTAAGAAAWAAAGEAAWSAAGDAAWEAAWSAALLALVSVCDGLALDQKHIDHANLRWNLWRAGYGVRCDVNGVLYCYRRVA